MCIESAEMLEMAPTAFTVTHGGPAHCVCACFFTRQQVLNLIKLNFIEAISPEELDFAIDLNDDLFSGLEAATAATAASRSLEEPATPTAPPLGNAFRIRYVDNIETASSITVHIKYRNADGALVYVGDAELPQSGQGTFTSKPAYLTYGAAARAVVDKGDYLLVETKETTKIQNLRAEKKEQSQDERPKVATQVEAPGAEIVPDDDQCGVTGDIVQSNKGPSGEKHYVSPKGDDSVILKAKLKNAADFDKYFVWDGGDPVAGHPEKRSVPRDAAWKCAVKILKRSDESAIVDKINVWIVWAAGEPINVPAKGYALRPNLPLINGQESDCFALFPARAGSVNPWQFRFTIEPLEMFDWPSDVPNLKGKNDSDPPPFGGRSPYSGKPFSEGVNNHWDVSRRLRDRVINKAMIPKALFPAGFGTLYNGQPQLDSLACDFPDDDVIGNDDGDTQDETYDALYSRYAAAPNIMESKDQPAIFVAIKAGADGSEYEEDFRMSRPLLKLIERP